MPKLITSTLLALSLGFAGACDDAKKPDDTKAAKATPRTKPGDKKVDSKPEPKPAVDKPIGADEEDTADPEGGPDTADPELEKPDEPADAPQMPPHMLVMRHEVKDYAKWKTAFDEHEKDRAAAGVVWHGLAHEEGKPNNLVIAVTGTDPDKLAEFVASKEVAKAMKDAGVKGKPKTWQLTRMHEGNLDPAIPDESINSMVLSFFEVAEFDAWKQTFEDNAEKRKAAGVAREYAFQATDNENKVLVTLQGKDLEALKAFMASPELAEATKAAGVKGKPDVIFATTLEGKVYEPGDEPADAAEEPGEEGDEPLDDEPLDDEPGEDEGV